MPLGGQGISLPIPQQLGQTAFPLPFNFAQQPVANTIALAAGNVMLIPPGWWYIDLGQYSVVMVRDPVNGILTPPVNGSQGSSLAATATARTTIIQSDGANFYVVNVKALPVGASVTTAGSSYTQSTVTVTPSTNSTDSVWHAIVGGAITSITIGADKNGTTGGTNFSLPPTLVIGSPPTSLANLPSTATALGGVNATATCTVSGGAINAITMVNQGAGYSSAPPVQIIPNPFDATLGSITLPTLTAVVGGAGTVTAVVLDHPGTAGGIPTLTIGGGGSNGSATAYVGIATGATDTIWMQNLGSS